jgi:chromosome segregation ATPase
MLKRDGPVILECQREMFQRKMPFRETQAALVYEEDIRAGWDSTRQTEDNHHRSRIAAETSLSETRQEIADLRERQARNEREKEDREVEARKRQFAEAEQKAEIEREEAERLRLEEIDNLRAQHERQFAEAEQKARDARKPGGTQPRKPIRREWRTCGSDYTRKVSVKKRGNAKR